MPDDLDPVSLAEPKRTLPNAPVKVPLIDLGRVWNGVFGDPSVVAKVVVGSALSLSNLLVLPIPFATPVLAGYFVMTARNAVVGEEHPLPEWTQLGDLWLLGIKYLGAMLAYVAPLVVLAIVAVGLMIGGAALGNDPAGTGLAVAGMLLYYGLMIGGNLLGLVARFTLFPVILIQLAVRGTFVSVFDLRELWDLFRYNAGNIVLTSLLQYIGGFLVVVGVCFCVLPAFPISFLVYVMSSAAFGQAQRLRIEAELAAAAPLDRVVTGPL